MSTHVKHDQKTIDKLVHLRAWDEAVVDAIAWCSSSFEPGSADAPRRTVSRIAAAAAEGDQGAVETIVRIIRRDFADHGPPGISEAIELTATDAVTAIGPRALPLLVPLLDDRRWQVAAHAMRALGSLGDVSVVPRIAEVYARTGEPDATAVPFEMWKREVRSQASEACTQLFRSDPEGYVRQGLTVENRAARTMLHTAAMYVVVKQRPSVRTYELRVLADELEPQSQ